MDELVLLAKDKKNNGDKNSIEYSELSETISMVSTSASERNTDIVSSTQTEVPGMFFTNPTALEKEDIEHLSNFEESVDENLEKVNSNNNNSKQDTYYM